MRFFVLAIALVPLKMASADWEYTHWGMSPSQVIAASHGAVHAMAPQHRLGGDMETSAEGTFTDGALKLRVSFGFRPKTGLALVTFQPEDASQNYVLRDRILRLYGPPGPNAEPLSEEGSWSWNRQGQDKITLSISDEGPAQATQHP